MLCVVSHDAGGAEIVSSYVRQQNLACKFVLTGPALKIFERKLGPIEQMPLDDALRQSDRLLCGTSWQSDIEWRAIELARSLGKPSAAFLDHWVNYRERFVRDGETHLPDEIWVGDALAGDMARALFPGLPVNLVDNPYFQDMRRDLESIRRLPKADAASVRILYVCEPLREHALREHGNERHWGYTEEDALRYFLNNLAALDVQISKIVLRPHPSEAPGKYDWAIAEFNLPIVRGGARTLFEEVVDAEIVVGCESMAMVVGMLAGKRMISSIPPGGRSCSLPQPEIEKLQTLVARGIGDFARNSGTVG